MTNDPKGAPDSSEAPRRPKLKRKAARSRTPERENSTIQFVYMDLETSMSVASAILRGGGVPVSRDQLAGLMNQASGGGNFVQKVASARLFGLVALTGGKYELTDLGFNIIDSDETRQKAARRDAFLNVPLYQRTYVEFRGKQLPPRPHGLEQAFVKFGVVPNQKTNARLAFDKSASQAGFFGAGSDRLVEPIVGAAARTTNILDETKLDGEGGFRADSVVLSAPTPPSANSDLHPFIRGLLQTLPEPNTNWAVEGRTKWLQAAANIFDLIYQGSGEIDIRARADASTKE